MAKQEKTYFEGLKRKKQGKTTNIPTGQTGFGDKLTKDGLVYKNDLLNTDYTSQRGIRRKLK